MRTSVPPARSATKIAGRPSIREIVCHCDVSAPGKRSTGAVLSDRAVTAGVVALPFATGVIAATVIVAAALEAVAAPVKGPDIDCPEAPTAAWEDILRVLPQAAGIAAARATMAAMRGRRTAIMLYEPPRGCGERYPRKLSRPQGLGERSLMPPTIVPSAARRAPHLRLVPARSLSCSIRSASGGHASGARRACSSSPSGTSGSSRIG